MAAAGALLAVPVLVFAAIGVASVIGDGRADDDRTVFADFTLPSLQTTNDGTPLRVLENKRNEPGLGLVDGELRHGAPTSDNAAGYLQAHLDKPLRRIGAIAKFNDPNSGAVGLLSSTESIADSSGAGVRERLPNSGAFFAATNAEWQFGVWDAANNAPQILLTGKLNLPTDGVGQAFEIVRYGETVVVSLPDGRMHAAADARLEDWAGPWAYWQLFEYTPAQRPATLTAVWAS